MVLASDLGFPVKNMLKIEAPWGGDQTKDVGKDAYLVVCDALYLINLDELGLPVAYIMASDAQKAEDYIVEWDNVPVYEDKDRQSTVLTRLPFKTAITIVEIAEELVDGRIRARIAHPAGWITMKKANPPELYVKKAEVSHEVLSVPQEVLLGTWTYATCGVPMSYQIVQADGGNGLIFIQESLRGGVNWNGDGHEAVLTDTTDGKIIGRIQLKFLGEGKMSSAFKLETDTKWGPEIVATKALPGYKEADENSPVVCSPL
jgi:hypothetical protein